MEYNIYFKSHKAGSVLSSIFSSVPFFSFLPSFLASLIYLYLIYP